MSVSRRISASVLALLCLGCASDGIVGPAGSLDYAAATGACGPADGAAVEILLASTPVSSLPPSPPYVRIYIARSADRLTGRAWVMGGEQAEAAADYHASAAEDEAATSGRVTVTEVTPDRAVLGTFDLSFPAAGRVRGEFHADWISRTVVCG